MVAGASAGIAAVNIVQCQTCTAILYDAERGPIVAAIEHRETCSPMVARFPDEKPLAPNPTRIQEALVQARAAYRRQVRRRAS